jgi:ATP diphosphatase
MMFATADSTIPQTNFVRVLNVMSTGEKFERAVAIMARLRAPGGCPWDREQTFDSIKPYTLEETYEVLEAIDKRDWNELPGELGDLLLQVLFYSEMAKESGHFSIDQVLDRLAEKLISRHPHVFGDVKAETSQEVLRNWEAIKQLEKNNAAKSEGNDNDGSNPRSILANVSSAMPSLLESFKLSSRAANVGFDWPNIQGLFEKLREEIKELENEIEKYPAPGPSPQQRGVAGSSNEGAPRVSEELRHRLEGELGDLFFVLVNIARYLSLDPESALRRSNRKFRSRFQYVETELRNSGRQWKAVSLEAMEELWQKAKQNEKSSK